MPGMRTAPVEQHGLLGCNTVQSLQTHLLNIRVTLLGCRRCVTPKRRALLEPLGVIILHSHRCENLKSNFKSQLDLHEKKC
jgi:hypothetical protein